MTLRLEELTYRYPGTGAEALDGLELEVAAGEVVAVVGPSGAGKSTLLRLVAGLLLPTAGRVVVDGTDVTRQPPERRPVAMLFQGYALFPHLTVRENIAFGPLVRRERRRSVARRVEEVAALLGLTELLHRRPRELSGGEAQRVAVARAVVRNPVVFCLDEPLSSLDTQLRAEARRALTPVLRDEGRCALYVTHDQTEAMTVADRVVVVRDGAVEQVGTPSEVYRQPANTFVATFIGDPPMNLVTQPDGTTVGVRAEHLHLGAGDPATVVAVEDRGHERHVRLSIEDGPEVVVRLAAEHPVPSRGDRLRVEASEDHLHRFGADGRRSR